MIAQGMIGGARKARPIGAVIPLLTLAVFIQNVDRGNIATAAPLIQSELGLKATQIGLLTSAFYWAYTPAQPLAGWLAQKFNPYRTMALGLALWSAATFATGFAGGFAALLLFRLLLGLGESVTVPCSGYVFAQKLDIGRLGAANGLFVIGLALGPAFGTWAGGNLMAAGGWRVSFLVFGLLSTLWLLPWWWATRSTTRAAAGEPTGAGPAFADILRRREAWGASIGHFCSNWGLYFIYTWLPLYLVHSHGLTMSQMAGVGAAVYGVYAISSWAAGVATDRWMTAGASANLVRKTAMVSSHLVMGSALIIGGFGGPTGSLACLFVTAAFMGINTPNQLAAGQTLAGPAAGGKWIGVQNCIGNVAGIIGPVVTGVLIDAAGGDYAAAFILAGAVVMVGAVFWGFVIRRIEPLEWRSS